MSRSNQNGDGRPALPRDAFRAQRARATAATINADVQTRVVVTPDYHDKLPGIPNEAVVETAATASQEVSVRGMKPHQTRQSRDPFQAYGSRTSSRPYALRLPPAIDGVIRQMAAEERTSPLRIIDRILFGYLEEADRLPKVERDSSPDER